MKKQARFLWTLLRMRLSHLLVFRLSFFGATFVDGSMFLLQIVMFSSIYAHVDGIGGWGYGEMLVFIGTFSLINALNMVLYFFGINDLPRKIIRGDLDHYLTKPGSPLFRLTFERIDLGSLPLVVLSLAIIAQGAAHLEIVPGPGRILGYAFLVLVMTVLWYDVELILRVAPFFTQSLQSLSQLEELLVLSFRLPGVLLRGGYKFLFYFVLPYGIMATLPTQTLAGTLSPGGYAYGLIIGVGFTALALGLWRLGLRHYKSASS